MESTPLSNNNEQENYRQFFVDAVDTGCVWGLQGEAGWAQCASEKYSETSVIPFWSQPEYIEPHRADEWSGYEIVAIALEEFLDDWLTGMHEDVVLVGINWDGELNGEDYEPLDILYEFERVLSD